MALREAWWAGSEEPVTQSSTTRGVVVALVGVDEGVVDADVSETADEDEGLGFEAFEEDLEVGAEEGGVAALFDPVVFFRTEADLGGDGVVG